MSDQTDTRTVPVEPRDEAPHEHGGEPGWSERLSFNFFDSESGFGGIARVEFFPGVGKAEGALSVFIPEGALAQVLVRDMTRAPGGHSVGRLQLDPYEALSKWRIRCKDVALLFSNATAVEAVPGAERRGAAGQLDLDLTFEAWMPPSGSVQRRTDVDEQHFVHVVSSGHFEQAGSYEGTIKVGNRGTTLRGTGVRDRSWGARARHATHSSQWFAVAFGPDLAFGARAVSAGARAMTSGWVLRDGMPRAVRELHAEIDYAGRVPAHVRVTVTDETSERYELEGETLATIPTREGSARAHHAMTSFRCGDRRTLGFVEYVEAG